MKYGWNYEKTIKKARNIKEFPYPTLNDGKYILTSTKFKEAYPANTLIIPESKVKDYHTDTNYYFGSYKDFPNNNGDDLYSILSEYDETYSLMSMESVFF
jgi:hypothetical protein